MNKKILIWILGLIVLSSFVSAALTDNIQYYFSMDDDDVSGTTLTDSAGNNDATLDAGIGSATGKIGESRDLSSTEKIDIVDLAFSSGQAFSLNLWINIDSFVSGHAAIIGSVSNTDYTSRTSTAIHVYPGSGSYNFATDNTLSTGTWTMITITRGTDNVIREYYNGVSEITPTANSGTYNWEVMGLEYGGGIAFDGKMDEVGIWNKELTQSEIDELYNSGDGYNPYAVIPVTPIAIYNLSPTNNSVNSNNTIEYKANVNITKETNCSLYVNNTYITSEILTGNGTKLLNFNVTYGLFDTDYEYYFYCFDNETNTTSKTNKFSIDVVSPSIVSELDPVMNYFTLWANYSFNASDTFLKNISWADSCGNSYTNLTPNKPLFQYDTDINISECGFLTKSFNITACDNFRCTEKTFWYQARGRIQVKATDIQGNTINNFTIYLDGDEIGSTTTGVYNIDNLTNQTGRYVGADYNVSIDNDNYELINNLVNMSSTFVITSFKLYTTNSINFTFLEEKFKTLIDDANISVEFVGDYKTYQYSTINGTLYADLIFPSTYVIRYKANQSYGDERRYHFTMNNRTHTDLTLYLLDNVYASDLIVTIYDQISLSTIEGALVYLQRYNVNTNSYDTIAMYESDVSGKAFFEVEQNTEYYKFLVDYPAGTRRLSSNPLYIQASTLNLYLNLLNTIGQTFYNERSISYSFTYDNNTNEFSVSYTDSALVSSEFCLYIKENGRYSQTILNKTCSSASSGSFSLGHPNEDGTYYAVFTGKFDGTESVIGTAWRELNNNKLGAGVFGIFMTIILIILLTFISQVSKYALIFGTSGLIFAKMLGILTIGWPLVLMALMLSIIIIIILEVTK